MADSMSANFATSSLLFLVAPLVMFRYLQKYEEMSNAQPSAGGLPSIGFAVVSSRRYENKIQLPRVVRNIRIGSIWFSVVIRSRAIRIAGAGARHCFARRAPPPG